MNGLAWDTRADKSIGVGFPQVEMVFAAGSGKTPNIQNLQIVRYRSGIHRLASYTRTAGSPTSIAKELQLQSRLRLTLATGAKAYRIPP